MKKLVSLSALALATVALLTGCAPDPTAPEPGKTFEVVAYIDAEEFQPNQQIIFNTLTPNQIQSKEVRVENLSNQDIIITNLSLITVGDLFDGDDVTVEVVMDSGETFDGVVLAPDEEAVGVIRLTTSDALRPGLNGTVSLGFDAEPYEAAAPETE